MILVLFIRPKPLYFSYDMQARCRTFTHDKNCLNENSSKSYGKVKSLIKNLDGTLLVLNNSYNGIVSETYSMVVSKNNQEVGSMSWISKYDQKEITYITKIQQLKTTVLSAGGIFANYRNGYVYVDYRKNPRMIKITAN
jgi:hypothetical protein